MMKEKLFYFIFTFDFLFIFSQELKWSGLKGWFHIFAWRKKGKIGPE